MPNRDGTGPLVGLGRGLGPCGFNTRRRWCLRYAPILTKEEEKRILEEELKEIELEKNEIERKLKELQ